jgi:hypothetical protein
MTSSLFVKGVETGAKAQNAEWFASDVEVGVQNNKALDFIVQFSVSVTPAVVEVTLDSGTVWSALNSGVAIPVGKLFTFEVFVKQGDLVNFRATNSSGTTVDICYIIGDLGSQ